MDELAWGVILVLIVACFWAAAFTLIAGALLIAVCVAALLAIPFGIGVAEGIRASRWQQGRVEELVALGCLRDDAERQAAGEWRLRKQNS